MFFPGFRSVCSNHKKQNVYWISVSWNLFSISKVFYPFKTFLIFLKSITGFYNQYFFYMKQIKHKFHKIIHTRWDLFWFFSQEKKLRSTNSTEQFSNNLLVVSVSFAYLVFRELFSVFCLEIKLIGGVNSPFSINWFSSKHWNLNHTDRISK